MANPRQRRKSRSSSHRPVSHSKNAKRTLKKMPTIRAPKVLQDAWDKNKTVRQNYAALGLIHDLNPSAAGGAEVVDVDINQNDQTTHPITDSAVSSTSENGSQGTSALGAGKPALPPQGSTIPKGYGRIVRDEVGNVVRIDYSDEEHNDKLVDKRYQDVDTNMEQLEPELDTSIKEKWIEGMGRQTGRAQVIVKKHFVEDLDKLSTLRAGTLTASLTGVGPRFTSQGEREYLGKLVEKYGQDVERMARDRRLNTDQRTEGELRRALERAGML